MSKKSVAIITARGGSKRIPRKNIKKFFGKPIIVYSIQAALDSKLFDEVMVSTDDQEISEIAKKYGAAVPFLRSKETSDDFSGTSDVLLEVLKSYQNIGIEYDYGCCLYPTAPFITIDNLLKAYRKIISDNLDTVFPIIKYSFPIFRSLKVSNDRLQPNWPEKYMLRSQDLPESFHDAGQFYWFRTSHLLKTKSLIGLNVGGIVISEMMAQDIDTAEDWGIAEYKFKLMKEGIGICK